MRGKQAHPTREGLDQVSADRAELYRCHPQSRLWVPILVQPLAVNDDILEEADIEIAVLGLKGGIAGDLLGMIMKDLKGWLQEAKCERDK